MRVLLAVLLLSAVAVAEDKPATFKEVEAAADAGDVKAQIRLGEWCLYTLRDYTEAVKWFRKAAEQEYADAQWKLGAMHFHGVGVSKNDIEAMKWYRKAA